MSVLDTKASCIYSVSTIYVSTLPQALIPSDLQRSAYFTTYIK